MIIITPFDRTFGFVFFLVELNFNNLFFLLKLLIYILRNLLKSLEFSFKFFLFIFFGNIITIKIKIKNVFLVNLITEKCLKTFHFMVVKMVFVICFFFIIIFLIRIL